MCNTMSQSTLFYKFLGKKTQHTKNNMIEVLLCESLRQESIHFHFIRFTYRMMVSDGQWCSMMVEENVTTMN